MNTIRITNRPNNTFTVYGANGNELYNGTGSADKWFWQSFGLAPADYVGLNDEEFTSLINGNGNKSTNANANWSGYTNGIKQQYGI